MILLQPVCGKKAQLMMGRPVFLLCFPSFTSFINSALLGLFHGFMPSPRSLVQSQAIFDQRVEIKS